MQAFITGSRVYGTPTEDSDLDMCICCDDNAFEILSELSDSGGESGGQSLMFWRLNLVVLGATEFAAWRRATQRLVAMKPVTREKAIEVIKEERQASSTTAEDEAVASDLLEEYGFHELAAAIRPAA